MLGTLWHEPEVKVSVAEDRDHTKVARNKIYPSITHPSGILPPGRPSLWLPPPTLIKSSSEGPTREWTRSLMGSKLSMVKSACWGPSLQPKPLTYFLANQSKVSPPPNMATHVTVFRGHWRALCIRWTCPSSRSCPVEWHGLSASQAPEHSCGWAHSDIRYSLRVCFPNDR